MEPHPAQAKPPAPAWPGRARPPYGTHRHGGGALERRPGTPSLLRELNDRAALELLLTGGPMTRAQLGEHTGLSKVTASQLLARLEERGLVEMAGELAGGRGAEAPPLGGGAVGAGGPRR